MEKGVSGADGIFHCWLCFVFCGLKRGSNWQQLPNKTREVPSGPATSSGAESDLSDEGGGGRRRGGWTGI